MTTYIPWNSQPLAAYAEKYAAGQFVTLDGLQTHFIAAGEGPPVILIHGFNMDSYTWAHNFDALTLNHRVYALDLWGFGYSSRERLDYGYPLFGKQVELFMDSQQIEKGTLIGHSMGGGTAIYFARHNPERVDRLVLVDAAGVPNPLPLRARLFQLPGAAEFLLGLNVDFVRRKNLADFWLYRQTLLTDAFFEAASRFQKIAGTTEALLTILRRQFFHTLEETLNELALHQLPTLIVWGREDKSVPLRCGEAMGRLLVGSRLEVIDEAGHMPNVDQAEQFNQIILRFLQEESVLS